MNEAERIFNRAVDLPVEERAAFVEAACGEQPALREYVYRMLAVFDDGSTCDDFRSPVPSSEIEVEEDRTSSFNGSGRFTVQRELGSGAFGTVYQVWDREQQITLAAKVLHNRNPDVLLRFKREFRSVVDIYHQNLVRLHELYCEGDDWFFTMELVDGEDFNRYVRPEGETCRIGRLRSALRQLTHGIRALHAAKRLHRDLKPANVLVTQSGRVVLLDFGLIHDLGANVLDRSMTFVGTPAYMSPEQAMQLPLTTASDWYSTGVMLFRALTGHLPHSGLPPLIEAESQHATVTDPRQLNPDSPIDLSDLCAQMLRVRPEERPTGDEILAVLSLQDVETDSRTPDESRLFERSDIFVGRRHQLDALNTAFGESQEGRLRVVLVEGPSGIGKTATMRRFLKLLAARNPNTVILKGRCYEFESVPYKGLDSLVDELTQYLHRLTEQEVNALLPREAFLLPRLFPVLGRVGAIANAPARSAVVPDEQELRQRTFTALREVLARLSDRHPVVIWIDDLQWGDRDSSTFLAELCAPPQPPALLLVLTYRSEDVRSNPTLGYLHQVLTTQKVLGNWRQVTIEGLSSEESERLVGDILSERPAIARELENRILLEGGGHPLFLLQLAYEAISREDMTLHGKGGELRLRDFLQQRVAELPKFARDVLEFACIAAQPLGPQILFLAASSEDVADADKAEAVALLVHENLARISGAGSERCIEAFHDQIRAAVVEMLSPEARRMLHARLARILAAQPQVEPQLLVTHYKEAGDSEAAHQSSLRAAEAAEHQLAFDRAALFYQIALDSHPNQDGNADLYRRLADTLGKAGRGYDSAQAYLQAAGGRGQNVFELRRLAADQLMRSGHIDEAMALVKELAQICGLRMVHSPLQAMMGIAWGRIRTRLRFMFGVPTPRARTISPKDQARLQLLQTAGIELNLADPVQATYFQIEYVLAAIRIGEPLHLANALSIEASIRVSNGTSRVEAAAALITKAQQIAEEIGHRNTIGFVYLCRAYFDYLLGRIPDGIEHADKAVDFLREHCTGTAWELTAAYVLLFWFLCWSGNVDRVRELLPQLLKEGAARGDVNVEVSLRLLSYIHYAYLSADEPEECLRETRRGLQRWSKKGFHLQHYGAMFTRVETYLYMGNYAQAREELLKDWEPMSRSFILRWQILTIMALLLRGRVALACWLGDRLNRALYAEVESNAKRLQRIRSPWGQPTASVLYAGLAVGQGDRDGAIRHLEAAYDGFDKLALHAYAFAARNLCGRLRNDELGRELCREAEEFLRARHVKDQTSFMRMLLPGEWLMDGGARGVTVAESKDRIE